MSTSTTTSFEPTLQTFEGLGELTAASPAGFQFFKSALYNGQASSRFANFWRTPASNFLFQEYVASQASSAVDNLRVRPTSEAVYGSTRTLVSIALTGARYYGNNGRPQKEIFQCTCPCVLHDVNADGPEVPEVPYSSSLPDALEFWAMPVFNTEYLHHKTHLFDAESIRGDSSAPNIITVQDLATSDVSTAKLFISKITSVQSRLSVQAKHKPNSVREELMKDSNLRDSLAAYFCKRICMPHPETYVYGAVYRKDLTEASLQTERPHLVVDVLVTSARGIPSQTPPLSESGCPTGFDYSASQTGLKHTRSVSTAEKGYVRVKIFLGMFKEDYSEALWFAQGGCAKILAASMEKAGVIFNKNGLHLDLGESGVLPLAPDQSSLRNWTSSQLFTGEDPYSRQVISYPEVAARALINRSSLFSFLQSARVIDQGLLGLQITGGGTGWTIISDRDHLSPEARNLMRTFTSGWYRSVRIGTARRESENALKDFKLTLANGLSYSSSVSEMYKAVASARKATQLSNVPVPDFVPEDKRDALRRRFLNDPVFRVSYLKANDHNRHILLIRQGFVPLELQAA